VDQVAPLPFPHGGFNGTVTYLIVHHATLFEGSCFTQLLLPLLVIRHRAEGGYKETATKYP